MNNSIRSHVAKRGRVVPVLTFGAFIDPEDMSETPAFQYNGNLYTAEEMQAINNVARLMKQNRAAKKRKAQRKASRRR